MAPALRTRSSTTPVKLVDDSSWKLRGLPQNVCTGCSLNGFLSDNRSVLAEVDGARSIRLYDSENGTHETLLPTAEGVLDRPHASPDDRWLARRSLPAS